MRKLPTGTLRKPYGEAMRKLQGPSGAASGTQAKALQDVLRVTDGQRETEEKCHQGENGKRRAKATEKNSLTGALQASLRPTPLARPLTISASLFNKKFKIR